MRNRRFLAILSVIGVLLGLCGCAGAGLDTNPGTAPSVNATNPEQTIPTEPAPVVYTKNDLTFEDRGNGYDYIVPVGDDCFNFYNGKIPAELVTFTSSDETIAKVGKDGTVIPLLGGTVTIQATYGEWKINAVVTCTYAETDLAFQNIGEAYSYNLTIGAQPYQLDAGKIPAAWVTFTSSDETVATVDEEGKVTAVAKGTAVITAKYDQWQIMAVVNCREYEPVYTKTDLTFKNNGYGYDYSVNLSAGRFVIYNGNIPAEKVTFTSSNTSVATVGKDGVITLISGGNATITAKYGEWTISGIVRCKDDSPSYSKSDLTFVDNDYGYDYTLRYEDDGFVIYDGNIPAEKVTFTSSDETVAYITSEGKIRIAGTGVTTITAQYNSWTITATVRVV